MGTVLAGAACSTERSGGGSARSTTTAPTAPESNGDEARRPGIEGSGVVVAGAIRIEGFAFKPIETRAGEGATIIVVNYDGTDHSVTAIDGSFDTGRFSNGAKTITVPAGGRIEYRCEVHSFMPHGFIQAGG